MPLKFRSSHISPNLLPQENKETPVPCSRKRPPRSSDKQTLGNKGIYEHFLRETRVECVEKERTAEEGGNIYEEPIIGGGSTMNTGGKDDGFDEKRKARKKNEDNDELCDGWSKEEESALEKACHATKPTPSFWKNVAKMVPGKSAQDCYDKVYSGLLTPPRRPPRSRAKKSDASACGHFSPLVSKLLSSSEPSEPNFRKSSSNKSRSQVGHKMVRKLLQKNFNVEDQGAELFSVLEGSGDPSTNGSEPSVLLLSAPNHVEDLGPVRKCHHNSSPGKSFPFSRVSNISSKEYISPPVLKQVRNRVLHEKYVDLLHNREAKRKAAYAKVRKSFSGKENKNECNVPKTDVVRAAKNALISEAKEAISQLKTLQANETSSSSDFDSDLCTKEDEDGGES